ncbi:LysE family translocator [Myroides sp. NP-2]|uniref:LysE family translocator n=1 Tax=Myroides sp. NP-2 TaxID=2759945 RepID=UPI0015F9CC29|nr:LysE family translocator [Myroides sp. NP-2]MBB1149352.1 LysE family translocator [Myroides sp. NP-2]
MIPFPQLALFALAALVLAITPGPNMIYLISRTLAQGKKAGLMSLFGVMVGFLFHILLVSFGLTAVLFAIPYAYTLLKWTGALYLVYLAFQALKPNGKNIFEVAQTIQSDSPRKLFSIGFLTNVLNPKVAVFYLSLFPQFIKPDYGPVLVQSLTLGTTQLLVSFLNNLLIILFAAKLASFFQKKPFWVKIQKWFMGSVLLFLATKMVLSKGK